MTTLVNDPNPTDDDADVPSTVAAPAAPATPKAPAAQVDLDVVKVDKAAPAVGEDAVVEVAKTGDPAVDIAREFLARSGFKAESVAMQQAEKGDFSILKAMLAEKGTKGGDQYVALLEQAHARKESDAQASRERTKALVVGVFGDDQTWAAAKEVVANNATEAELEEINAALKKGGLVAKATAEYMKRVYEAATGGKPAESKPVGLPSTRSSVAPSSGAPLSPKEYVAAVAELSRKVGTNNLDRSPEYAKLQQRRRAFRG